MLKDSLSLEDRKREYVARYERGIRKEELDGHYPWYGLDDPGCWRKDLAFRV